MERWIRSIFSLKIMQQYVWYWHRTAIRLNMKRDSRLKDWMSSKKHDGYYCFHAGTKFNEDGKIVTNGGRVLGVTAKRKRLKRSPCKCLCSNRVGEV